MQKSKFDIRKKLYLESPYLKPIVSPNQGVVKCGTLSNLSKALDSIHYSRSTSVNTVNRCTKHPKTKTPTKNYSKTTERKLPITYSQCNIKLRFVSDRPSTQVGATHQVCIYQQINWGSPVNAYQGRLGIQDTFTFTSRRHGGFPFSITIYVNSLLVQRISVCCEYKLQTGSKLGGAKGIFTLISVEGSLPCYKCQMVNIRKKKIEFKETSTKQREDSSESEACSPESSKYDDDFEDDDSEIGDKEQRQSQDLLSNSTHDNNIVSHTSSEATNESDDASIINNDNQLTVDSQEIHPTAETILQQLPVSDIKTKVEEFTKQLSQTECQYDEFKPERDQPDFDDNSLEENTMPENINTVATANDNGSNSASLSSDDETTATDDDVVYQSGEKTPSSASSTSHGKGQNMFPNHLKTTPNHANRNSDTDYYNRKQFDSSDDEDGDENTRQTACVTITADVHNYNPQFPE